MNDKMEGNWGIGIVSPIRGVIFDLDGTLLDTIEDITEASNRVYGARGLAPFSAEEMKKLVGEGAEELVRKVFASRGRPPLDEAGMAAVIRDYRREYETCWRVHSRPYAGVPELLSELSRRGVKTAILSNKAQSFTSLMAEALLPTHAFDIVRGARPGVPLKPDPAPALAIAAELGLAPAACAFVGDTSIDITTARAAGMFAAGALWGFRTAEELRSSGAAALLALPADLLRLV
jgi:phosphoglycolate phosphatase